jgi:hypothetical protein
MALQQSAPVVAAPMPQAARARVLNPSSPGAYANFADFANTTMGLAVPGQADVVQHQEPLRGFAIPGSAQTTPEAEQEAQWAREALGRARAMNGIERAVTNGDPTGIRGRFREDLDSIRGHRDEMLARADEYERRRDELDNPPRRRTLWATSRRR